MDLLTQTRAIDSVPTLGFVESNVRNIVISKFLSTNALPPIAERMILLQFENATELVLTQPHEYGLDALKPYRLFNTATRFSTTIPLVV